MLDAGRGELYVGEYDFGEGRLVDERLQQRRHALHITPVGQAALNELVCATDAGRAGDDARYV